MNNIEPKDIKEFYNQVYKSGDIRDNIRQYIWILKLAAPLKEGSKILDIGCGIGYLLDKANIKRVSSFGFDLSLNALEKGRKIFPTLKVCVADGEYIPFKDKTFAVAFSLGSLEHFLNPDVGLREIHRVLKDDGKVILVLLNSFSLEIISKVLFEGRPQEQWQIQEKLLTKEEWKVFIEKNGFEVEKVFRYNKYPELFQEGTLKLKSLGKYFKNLLVRLFCPLNFSWQFVFVCKKV